MCRSSLVSLESQFEGCGTPVSGSSLNGRAPFCHLLVLTLLVMRTMLMMMMRLTRLTMTTPYQPLILKGLNMLWVTSYLTTRHL